jgi:hypothetical protein
MLTVVVDDMNCEIEIVALHHPINTIKRQNQKSQKATQTILEIYHDSAVNTRDDTELQHPEF